MAQWTTYRTPGCLEGANIAWKSEDGGPTSKGKRVSGVLS